jgi:hypothetical protein
VQRADQQRTPFDAVLKRGLQRQREPGGKDCPDDSTFAAYCDRSLPPSESALWEAHFSNCARCQGMLAAMARAQTAARAALPPTARGRWQTYAAFAAGLAGISIAVGLMVTGRRQSAPADLSARNELTASAPVAGQAPPGIETAGPQIALNEPAPQANPGTSAPSQQHAAIGAPMPFRPMAGPGGFSATGPAARFASSAGESGKEPAPRPALRTKTVAQAPPLPSAPPALAMKEREFAILGATNATVAAPATAESVAPGVGMATESRTAARVSVSTADGIERWRLGEGGMIQHLGSDGEWYRQTSGVSNDLTAGAAPSPEVCWVVGTGGTVVRTNDGEHWHRLNSPTAANLVAVSAVDASSAVVTAADGQRFSTTDGGRTWRPL